MSDSFWFFQILFIFYRGDGREREGNINVWLPLTCPLLGTWPATQACARSRNWNCDPLVCKRVLSPLSHTSHGSLCHHFDQMSPRQARFSAWPPQWPYALNTSRFLCYFFWIFSPTEPRADPYLWLLHMLTASTCLPQNNHSIIFLFNFKVFDSSNSLIYYH